MDRKRKRLSKDSTTIKLLSSKRTSTWIEEDISALKRQMEFILGVTKTGLDIIDSEFNVRYIDPEWAKVYGDPTGRKCYEYFMGGKAPCPGCGIPKALQTKKPIVTEEILVKENSRPIQVTTIPFQNSDGEWLVAEVNVDISERKRMEEALRKAHGELEIRIQERTAQLALANEAVQLEIIERKQAEGALRRSEEETRRLAQENAIMAEIGRIISSSLNIEDVYEQFPNEVHKLIPFDEIAINIINHKEGTVSVPFVSGISVSGCKSGDILLLTGSVTGEVMQKRSSLIIQTEERDELQNRFPALLTAFDTGLRSVIVVPLISKDQVIGAIHFRSTQSNSYSDQDLKLAENIASQIAGAIANAKIFSERKRAEESLRESQQLLKKTFASLREAVFIIDAETVQILDCNPAASEIFGHAREEMVGRTTLFLHVDSAALEEFRKHMFASVEEKGFLYLPEFRMKRKNGEVFFTEHSVMALEDDQGKRIGWVSVVRDITERKRAEEELHAGKQRFQALSEQAPFGMVMIDQDGTFKYVNPKFRELFGYDLTDVPNGKAWFRKAYPETTYRHHVISDWLNDSEGAKPEEKRSRVFTAICKDGTEKIINFISVQLKKGDNLVACEDITERKRAEEALRESEERYRTILENIEDGYYEVDLSGNFTFFNDSLCRMLGYSRDEMMGMGNQQYTDPENRKTLFQAFNEVYRAGVPTKAFDWEVIRKDGAKIFGEVSVSPIRDSKGQPIGFRGIARDITERKRAEGELRDSEERFRIAAKSSSDLIWDWDILNGRLEWFGNIDERLGYNPGDFPRTIDAWEKIIHPDEHDRVMTALDQHLKMHKPYVEEYRVQRRDGTFYYWIDRGTAIWDEKGNPFKMIGACEDITERKRSEESLEKSEMRFMELFNEAPVGYFEYNVEGLITNVNRTYLEMLGYKIEEMIGKPVWKFIVENEVARQQILEKLAGITTPARGIERTYRRKDGTTLPVLVEDRVLRDSAGKITGIRATIHDITERKHAEEALKESEEKYRQLVEYAPSGIFEIDLNTLKFLNVNDVMCEVMGYSKEELFSMSPVELLTEESRNLLAERIKKTRPGEKIPDSAECKLRKKDKSEFWALVNTKMFYKDGKPFKAQVVAQDISERKRLEEQLTQSQKMEAVGQLAGGIAHDFNNLLTVIKGYGHLSLLNLKEGDPLWGNIQEIQKATQRASDLTRQLLAFSRRQILDPKVLNLNSLVKDLNKMLHRIIGEDIELITLLDEDLGRVKVDPGQIEQMILNLAVNARDAMPSGGKLIIETKDVEIDAEYVAAHIGLATGRYVRLSVSDTGVGMSKEIIEKAFEPFFTTKETGKGTGLGLSTVYGIVKQSGGSIWVYSEPGYGTTFNIYLPRVKEDLDALGLREESDFLPKGSETVLLVEDESSVRNLAYRILCQQGYTVLEAANGHEALCIAQERIGKKIDLLLTDVVMPKMSGKELADRIKTLRPELKVLFTSGYTNDAIVHHGVLAPGTHFLQKPFSFKSLSCKVREVLDR